MNSHQKVLIQSSFLKLVGDSLRVADVFYAKLFHYRPDVEVLFKSNRTIQREKFVSMLGFLINNIYDETLCEQTLKALAQRHVTYGVKQADFEAVGQALIVSLESGLGEDFTPEVEAAWRAFYSEVSGYMIEAAF